VFTESLCTRIAKLAIAQERRNQLEKLNMAIGTYFSEVGTPLLKAFSSSDPNVHRIRDALIQLWEVFHLADEFEYRNDLALLSQSNYQPCARHERAYRALIVEWLKYMDHLKKRYPYPFSLALRTNPFDETASPIVTEQMGE